MKRLLRHAEPSCKTKDGFRRGFLGRSVLRRGSRDGKQECRESPTAGGRSGVEAAQNGFRGPQAGKSGRLGQAEAARRRASQARGEHRAQAEGWQVPVTSSRKHGAEDTAQRAETPAPGGGFGARVAKGPAPPQTDTGREA